MNLEENLKSVKDRIEEVCRSSSRKPSDVDLMLVTKTITSERIIEAKRLGHRLFGENKVQEVVQKWSIPELREIRPDFIGHLQTNKLKACLDGCGRIHSVDRMSLVEALDRELQKRGEQREVFIQVNTSGEASKYGIAPVEAVEFATQIARYQTLKVTGLMTLAIFSTDKDRVRECFRKLKALHLKIRESGVFTKDFTHLSMGMSSDFDVAIEEGSTMIRVGQAVFGTRSLPDSYYWPGASS